MNNKRKGSRVERKYRLIFRQIGFSLCETSRYASTLLDACKIDLVNLPFNIQIKAGKQIGLNPAKELYLMLYMIENKLDSSFKKPCFLLHEKEIIRGKRREEYDSIIYFTLDQFTKFKQINKDLVFKEIKKYNKFLNTEFEFIVCVSFKYFETYLIPIIRK